LDPEILKYPENYDFIVCAMDYVSKRNDLQKKGQRDFAISKLLYSKKQAVIVYAIFDDIEPLKKIAKEWAKIQMPPADVSSDRKLVSYAKKLAAEEMPSVSYRSPISLKGELKMIQKHCEKHPEDCDKLYLTPLEKGKESAAGGPEYVDPTGYKKPTFQLPMTSEPTRKLPPGLAALSRGKRAEWPNETN
jgi:hypothetical protein